MAYWNTQYLAAKITSDYRVIFNRFWKTLSFYAQSNPAVANVKQSVKRVHFNILLSDAHVNHLQKICRLLDVEKKDEPIILKLHQALCADIEIFKRGATVDNNAEYYF